MHSPPHRACVVVFRSLASLSSDGHPPFEGQGRARADRRAGLHQL